MAGIVDAPGHRTRLELLLRVWIRPPQLLPGAPLLVSGQSTVSRIERGFTPGLTTAAMIVHVLDADLHRLVFGESYER